MTTCLAVFVVSFLLAVILTNGVRMSALTLGLVDKPDNYFRVCLKTGGDSHVFPFASSSHTEAHWAYAESLRIFDELGGTSKGATRSLWKPHHDFKVIGVVGEGARIEEAPKKTKHKTDTIDSKHPLN